MRKAIVVREQEVVPFVSQPPQKREFRVMLSPLMQDKAPDLVSVGTATVMPGQTTPRHSHQWEEEIWYVLSGWGNVVVGNEIISALPGTLVVAPEGVMHHLENRSVDEPFKCLVIFTPAGPEEMFLPVEVADAA